MQEDLTPETTIKILDSLCDGKAVKPGPQSGRHSSEPAEGRTALTSEVSVSEWLRRVRLAHALRSALRPGQVLRARVRLDRYTETIELRSRICA